MSDLRTAAQLAVTMLKTGMPEYDARDVLEVLEAALAQPEQEPLFVVEGGKLRPLRPALLNDGDKLYTRPPRREWREQCRYPDCVDNGPEGKCIRWLTGECSGPKKGQA